MSETLPQRKVQKKIVRSSETSVPFMTHLRKLKGNRLVIATSEPVVVSSESKEKA